MGERKALHAYVSDSAHDQWHEAAADWGVTVSAILEVLAPELGTDTSPLSPDDSERLIAAARSIDAQRRRRTRKR